MKMKKAASVGIAMAAAVSMMAGLAGCGSSGGNTTNVSGSAESTAATQNVKDSGEMETIVFATPLSKTVDMTQIEEELNKITEEKINVHVKIEGISMANYSNQIGLMMSGGEQLDVFGWIGNYSALLSKNQLMAIDDLLDEYGAGTKEVLGEEFLKATTSGGHIYGLSTNNGKGAVMSLVLRDDLIEELSLPVEELTQASDFEGYCKNLEVITQMFEKIHAAHPEMACVVPNATNPNSLVFTQVPFFDGLNDNLGVLMPGEDSKIENLYASEEFARLCEYAYEWNQAGYVLEDATTTQEAYLYAE